MMGRTCKADRCVLLMGISLFLLSCSNGTALYEMPSLSERVEPEWMEQEEIPHDSTYVTIRVQADESDLQAAGQEALSLLNQRIAIGLSFLLEKYFDEKMPGLGEDERFAYYARLPVLIERIMAGTDVRDGWVSDEGLVVLCALDVEITARILVDGLDLPAITFTAFLKRNLSLLTRPVGLP